ncbi:MAG: hypothetical protein RLN76_10980 [Phycisphaeraceae bacterium]
MPRTHLALPSYVALLAPALFLLALALLSRFADQGTTLDLTLALAAAALASTLIIALLQPHLTLTAPPRHHHTD